MIRTHVSTFSSAALVGALALLCGACNSTPADSNGASVSEASFDTRPIDREAEFAADAEPVWTALVQLLGERADGHELRVIDFPRRARCRIREIEITAAVDVLDVGRTRVRLWTDHPLRFDRSIAGTLLDETAARLRLPKPAVQALEGPRERVR
ncbi:MAG: hypothetical protein EPO68_11400 [Planctomycetota bacterium]|nr:MAG: hypothetical protein EPO68_11400 [Planctomycetota bacterium]